MVVKNKFESQSCSKQIGEKQGMCKMFENAPNLCLEEKIK